jgi:endonuclease YncB( thermonuclease family)
MRRLAPVLAILAWVSLAPAADFAAKVVGVDDGDTITVLTAAKERVKIRLHRIDAPEAGQDFGDRAKRMASELAFGKEVMVRERDKDRFGRVIAEIILPDGKSLNREMVRGKMAWWYKRYAPGDREPERLQAEAKAAKRGLWSQPDPTPPWEWRRPKAAEDGRVVGNARTRVYPAPNCPSVARMKEANRMAFGSAKDAEAAGYRRAGDCRRDVR